MHQFHKDMFIMLLTVVSRPGRKRCKAKLTRHVSVRLEIKNPVQKGQGSDSGSICFIAKQIQ
jgi:hypothetical protein